MLSGSVSAVGMKKFPELREGDQPCWSAPAPRPGDGIDPRPHAPDVAELLAGKHAADAADIFRRLIADCLPTKRLRNGAKGERRWLAAYRRLVVIAYCVTPEQFLGMKQGEVAEFLGIDREEFNRRLAATSDQLSGRGSPSARRQWRTH